MCVCARVCACVCARVCVCVRTISAQKQRAEARMMFDVLSVGDGKRCVVIFLLKQQQQTFQHYKVSKVELDPSLHFHPSLTQLTSCPFFHTGQPQHLLITFSPASFPISLNYIGFSTWEVLFFIPVTPPRNCQREFYLPQSLPYSPERIHFLSWFLLN